MEGSGSHPGVVLLPREHLTTVGHIFHCHDGGGGAAVGIRWVEVRDAVKHPAHTRLHP